MADCDPPAPWSEPEGLPPGRPGNATGMAAIREKGRQFQAAIEAVHGVSVNEPVVAGNWFSVAMKLDLQGPRPHEVGRDLPLSQEDSSRCRVKGALAVGALFAGG